MRKKLFIGFMFLVSVLIFSLIISMPDNSTEITENNFLKTDESFDSKPDSTDTAETLQPIEEESNEIPEDLSAELHSEEIESEESYSEPKISDAEESENEYSDESDYEEESSQSEENDISENKTDPEEKKITKINKNKYIDFESLWEINDDVYAWIYVPDTEVNYPIVQRKDDDGYYLRRDIYGKSAIGGTLFTEGTYNGQDFSDPVTVIYGHSMRNGTMFGSLESFGKSMSFDDDPMIYIYTPDAVFIYNIVAAVPYSDLHILYYNNFTKETIYNRFFNKLFAVRSLIANVNTDDIPQYGDKVVILSSCLKDDKNQRYLIVGKLFYEEHY